MTRCIARVSNMHVDAYGQLRYRRCLTQELQTIEGTLTIECMSKTVQVLLANYDLLGSVLSCGRQAHCLTSLLYTRWSRSNTFQWSMCCRHADEYWLGLSCKRILAKGKAVMQTNSGLGSTTNWLTLDCDKCADDTGRKLTKMKTACATC